ncbi:response regulator [Sandarakinorhabdus sp.]|uniref:response regulator n=1 Tax=Sandarakinorhabdus sp. TaxID=1916663 RepID=UPI00286DC1F0|nr:response regulator [Sandarakinorhabdus sp.]
MSLASKLIAHLPYLRRYARALTGSQGHGDALVAATLEAIIVDRSIMPADVLPRLGLYRVFQTVQAASAVAEPPPAAPQPVAALSPAATPIAVAAARLAAMTPLSRQALLLGAMEGFTNEDIGFLLDRTAVQVLALVDEAMAEIARQTAARVLIIEDEPIIAMDIEAIVGDLGHGVTGIATTHDEAMAMFHAETPGLVLADIQLADASSGIDAVRHILAEKAVPVIFITAFPERLLTGERPEPTFLISKPFQTATVQAAIAQALFFNSTESLHS